MIESYWAQAYFLFICAINLALVLFVYFRNPRHLVNRLFALSVLWVVFWTISNYFLHELATNRSGLLWGKTTFAMASLIPASFLAFAKAFPSSQKLPRDSVISAFAIAGVSLFFLSFTPFIVTDVSYNDRDLRLTYGPLYRGFALYFLLGVAASLCALWRKYRVVRGIERLRICYLFLGMFLAAAGGVTTNLVIPLFFHTSRFSWLGPAFTVFMFTFVAHAILRHRLMDVQVIIRKGVSFALSLLVSSLILFGASSFIYLAVSEKIPEDIFIVTVLIGTGVALAFLPLLKFSQALVDRYAYRAAYDYHETLQEAIRALSSFLERDALLAYIGNVIHKTVRAETISIYLAEAATFRKALFQSLTTEGLSSPPLLDGNTAFLKWFQVSREALVREEIPTRFLDLSSKLIFEELTERRWDLALPIWNERFLIGLIALGPKLSGDPYFSSDIQLLTTIAKQAGIVLTNASLYQEVKTVKEHIEGILKNMESGVVAVDRTGMIATVNAVAATVLGLRAPDLLGKPIEALPGPLASSLRLAIHQGKVCFQAEAEVQAQNGRWVPIVLSTSLLRDSQGQILGSILVYSDHSKIKELESEKRRAERLVAFQVLASGIAHEIKNPLVAIKTFAELLPERFTEDDFRSEFAKVVNREIERIDSLVARLRGLATSPTQPLTPLDLRDPVEETLALLRGQLEQARIVVKKVYEGELSLVAGDSAQLKQLFLNLFMNALEVMEPGGELSIRLAPKEEGGTQTIIVEITDTGTGIPEDIIGKIFDPFITTKPGGSGLGLSICRGIAGAHRASIRAQNNPHGKGTTITIEFPVVPQIPAETHVR